jgi:hypothetical protein
LELGGDEEIFGPGVGANFIGGANPNATLALSEARNREARRTQSK